MKPHNNPQLDELLARPVWAELKLTVRALNVLEVANIQTLRELVTKEERDLLAHKYFGYLTLKEIKEQLATIGLTLGMRLDDMEESSDIDDENILELLRKRKLPTV